MWFAIPSDKIALSKKKRDLPLGEEGHQWHWSGTFHSGKIPRSSLPRQLKGTIFWECLRAHPTQQGSLSLSLASLMLLMDSLGDDAPFPVLSLITSARSCHPPRTALPGRQAWDRWGGRRLIALPLSLLPSFLSFDQNGWVSEWVMWYSWKIIF